MGVNEEISLDEVREIRRRIGWDRAISNRGLQNNEDIDLNRIREEAQRQSVLLKTDGDIQDYIQRQGWSTFKGKVFRQFFFQARAELIEEAKRDRIYRKIRRERSRIQKRKKELEEYKRRDNLSHWIIKGKSMSHSQLRAFRRMIDVDRDMSMYSGYPFYSKLMQNFYNDHIFTVWVTEGNEGIEKLPQPTRKRAWYYLITYNKRNNLYGELVKSGAALGGWSYNPEGGGPTPMGMRGLGRRGSAGHLKKSNQTLSPAKLPSPDAKPLGKRHGRKTGRESGQPGGISSGGKPPRLLWTTWKHYPKVTRWDPNTNTMQVYAKIGGRFYTKHAVDRMRPSGRSASITPEGRRASKNRGFGRGISTKKQAEELYGGPGIKLDPYDAGRSISPTNVEAVIANGRIRHTTSKGGIPRIEHVSGDLKVITEQNTKVVITVID